MAGEQKLDFIYNENSAKPKDEDYLLGKTVDANYEKGTMGQINAVEYDCVPESIFSSKAEHQVDIQRKLQEDPLIELRKTEVETRKRILDNPLKMREIHSYIEKNEEEKDRKKLKKDVKEVDLENDQKEETKDHLLLHEKASRITGQVPNLQAKSVTKNVPKSCVK